MKYDHNFETCDDKLKYIRAGQFFFKSHVFEQVSIENNGVFLHDLRPPFGFTYIFQTSHIGLP